jgi:hypothetical protein
MLGKHNDHNFIFWQEKMKKIELPDLARKLIRKVFKQKLPKKLVQAEFENFSYTFIIILVTLL